MKHILFFICIINLLLSYNCFSQFGNYGEIPSYGGVNNNSEYTADSSNSKYVIALTGREKMNEIALIFKMPEDSVLLESDPLFSAQRLRKQGEYQQSLKIIDSLLSHDSNALAANIQKIYLLLRMDLLNYDKVNNLYLKIRDKISLQQSAYLSYIILYYKSLQTKNFDEVTRKGSELLKASPKDPLLYYNRGVCYVRKSRMDLAEKDFLKVLGIKPNDLQALYALAYCYKWLSRANKGVLVLNRAEALLENQFYEDRIDNLALFWLRASFYNQLGNIGESRKDLERATGYIIRNDSNPNPR